MEMHAVDLIDDFLVNHYGKPGIWIDFGHSMWPETGQINADLVAFKESFGARAVLQSSYRITL